MGTRLNIIQSNPRDKMNAMVFAKSNIFLPSALTKKQEEKQELLKQIKKEISEEEDAESNNINENTGEREGGEEERIKTKEEPRIFAFTNFNDLLKINETIPKST